MEETIIIGSDHAGFDLKEIIKQYLTELKYNIEDVGCYNKTSIDYPIIAKKLTQKVIENKKRGILICGSGVGMCICANKTRGIRAVVCSDTTSARLSREHNYTNVLCIGARIIGENLAKDICKIWLDTEFEGGRHKRRIDLIENE